MKGKHIVLLLVIAAVGMLFFCASINAEESSTVQDVIKMDNTEAFETHKMGIVMFDHKKHFAAKPDGYGIACGECHHDKDGKPRADLKEGDTVEGCIDCHSKPGKPKKEKGMSKEDWDAMQLEYYYGAMHENCIGCHKENNAGPTKCAECHPKPEK